MIGKSEAFYHNSCKKLAQLTKVVCSLSSAAKDKEDEQAEISSVYEASILTVFDRHRKKTEEIHSALVKFRKSCIQKYCNEYGNRYQALKNDLTEFVSSQKQKIAEIIHETEVIKSEIERLSDDANDSLMDTMDSANAMLRQANSESRRAKRGQREANNAVSDINDQTKAILTKFEQTMKELTSRHIKNKSELMCQIAQLNQAAIQARMSDFIEYKKDVSQLNDEIADLRERHRTVILDHKQMRKNNEKQKKAILNNVNQAMRDFKKEKKSIASQIKLEQQQLQSELTAMEKEAQSKRLVWESQINECKKKIGEIRRKSSRVSISESKSRDVAFASIMESNQKGFEDEKRKLRERRARIGEEVETMMNEIQTLYKYAKESTAANLEQVKARKGEVAEKIEAAKRILSEQLKGDMELFEQEMGKQLSDCQRSGSSRKKGKHRSPEKKALNKLEAELEKQKQDQETKLQKARTNVESEIESYKKAVQTRQEQKKGELEKSYERRKAEKDKKLTEIQQKFATELNEKKKEREKQIQAKLAEVYAAKPNPTNELASYEQKKTQLTSMSEFLSKQILTKKEEREKALERFNSELAHVDKLKRQLQRRIETETRGIDDEYEMKIQVEQVNLQKTIENISKLYDEEENRRGREVIEMVRKVRETKNRIDDFLKRKRKEAESIALANQKRIETLESDLAKLQGQTKENEMKNKIKEAEDSIAKEIKVIEDDTAKQIQAIESTEEKYKSQHKEAIAKLDKQTKQTINSIQDQISAIEKEISEIEKSKNEKLNSIRAEVQSQQEKLATKASSDCDKVRARIETAKTRKSNLQTELSSDMASQQEKFEESVTQSFDAQWEKSVASSSHQYQEISALDAEIDSLWNKKADMIKQQTQGDDTYRISTLRSQVAACDTTSASNALINFLENGCDDTSAKIPHKGSCTLEKLAPLQAP